MAQLSLKRPCHIYSMSLFVYFSFVNLIHNGNTKVTHFKADGLTNKLSTHFGNVPIPSRMLNLRRLNSGLPIPKFATWEEDKPNLTVMNRDFFGTALRNKLCWICGQKMGRFASFVGGPKSTASKCFVDPPQPLVTHQPERACLSRTSHSALKTGLKSIIRDLIRLYRCMNRVRAGHVLGIDHLDQSYTKTYRIRISTSSLRLHILARRISPLSSCSAHPHHQNPF
ncbi:hypothetical protein NBRC3188_2740 [Acetobacter pasteurianus NBRC 3188]|uniref:Uncharacterized protein n=1 Tax=Acetobacter pasteurianus NBRC 3188 TaxID=1226663 RepID=A0A401WXM2_ACEPA|nr:hypothetical protein NBRC3188_2740 [Acetobacter pasteurianus NBRC 3188]